MFARFSTRQHLLIAGIVQGAILAALDFWFRTRGFSASDILWVAPAYTFALFSPITFHFLRGEFSARRSVAGAAVVGVVLAAVAFGFGAALFADGEASGRLYPSHFGKWLSFSTSMLVVWFVGLPLLQAALRGHGRTLPYPGLFDDAWRNALLVANCIAFTVVFWILLSLWAGLFSLIGINTFVRVFSNAHFIYFATAIAVSFAVSLEEKESAALASLRRFLLAFQTRLAPLCALIVVLFIAALPLTGIAPLWQTGWSSPLILVLQASLIFLVNAAWQEGQQPAPFSSPVNILIRAALALLPILSAICIWSLWLRIAQHGWSVDRVWAAVAVGLTTLYAIGYAAAAICRGWLPWLGKVNTGMAFVLIGTLLALWTPLLDPQRISANSQLARLISGAVAVEHFDFNYLRNDLGRPGRDALQTLSQLSGHPQAEKIRERAAQDPPVQTSRPTPPAATAIEAKLKKFPADATIPPGFAQYLHGWLGEQHTQESLLKSVASQPAIPILVVDLGGDTTPEVVLMEWPWPVFGFANRQWHKVGQVQFKERPPTRQEIRALLEASKFSAAPRTWKDLRLGEQIGELAPDIRGASR